MLVGSEKILDWMVARGHEQRHAAQILHDPGPPHMVHSHTLHLPLGALLIWCTMCGTGRTEG